MRIGVDLGGSKIEVVALGDGGALLARRRRATPGNDYDAIVRAVGELVGEVERECRHRGSVGVAAPGALSPATRLIKNSNTTCLNGRSLDVDLARALDRPVRLANDANCFALSEATDGAAAGAEVVFGVILGTGTGGGIVVRGEVLRGPHAIAGEWGHNPLPWPTDEERPGPPCYCGRQGCIETFLSGAALASEYRALSGRSGTGEELAAADRDEAAEDVLGAFERRLAKSMAAVVNVLDPNVIVLGGGLSNIERLYRNVPGLMAEWVFSDTFATPIRPARHGDASGVRGAAWLWAEGESAS